jgi:hypothetical protein
LKLLLAIRAPVRSFRQEQLSDREDHTDDATLAFPVGNYVSADLGNYVSGNRLNLGNYVSADRGRLVVEPCLTGAALEEAGAVAASVRVIEALIEHARGRDGCETAPRSKVVPADARDE